MDNENENKSKRYNMVYSSKLTDRIIAVQNKKGFKYRSDTVTYLLNIALDILETSKEK